MSSSTHIDNKKKDLLVLRKGPTQGLEHTLTSEKMYSISFTVIKKKFCLSLHYNVANSYLFVNGTKIYKLKVKDSTIVTSTLCLGNISKGWSVDNMKKTGFNGYVYDFSADYDVNDVDNIKDIHKYLMKENNIVKKMFKFIKRIFSTRLTILSSLTSTITLSNKLVEECAEIVQKSSEYSFCILCTLRYS